MKIQESMRHPVTMSFTILRTGYDLQQRTSLACFILPNGNATQDIDYVININNLGEIIIPPRATEINVSIEILNDTLVEGTEGFRIQMTDPYYNGKMTNPSTMEVAILDAKKGEYACMYHNCVCKYVYMYMYVCMYMYIQQQCSVSYRQAVLYKQTRVKTVAITTPPTMCHPFIYIIMIITFCLDTMISVSKHMI